MCVAKTKALVSCAVTEQKIRINVFHDRHRRCQNIKKGTRVGKE